MVSCQSGALTVNGRNAGSIPVRRPFATALRSKILKSFFGKILLKFLLERSFNTLFYQPIIGVSGGGCGGGMDGQAIEQKSMCHSGKTYNSHQS